MMAMTAFHATYIFVKRNTIDFIAKFRLCASLRLLIPLISAVLAIVPNDLYEYLSPSTCTSYHPAATYLCESLKSC
jgi:hypothetical protein